MKRSTENLRHTRWECKYHVVFIPKYRKKSIYGWVRKELGPILRDLAQQKESVVEEGHLMADHVHMLLSIPPKYSVSGVVGFIKGKSAIAIARISWIERRTLWGRTFGRGDITCPRWGGMKRRSESISGNKIKRISGSIN